MLIDVGSAASLVCVLVCFFLCVFKSLVRFGFRVQGSGFRAEGFGVCVGLSFLVCM